MTFADFLARLRLAFTPQPERKPAVTVQPPPVKSGLVRIVMHWTAGGANASGLDRSHYHFMVQQDGTTVAGTLKPEDNISASDGRYAAHTRGCNTGAIGIAMCGMMGAVERPFNAGKAPMQAKQVDAFCRLAADLCRRYGIPVTRQTVLTHAEVQPTLGIAQAGKWDICWLPGMAGPGDPITVADRLRAEISKLVKGA
jgi:N-acetyl-anhydromuramyl-L-alanine amidase AmpD